MHGKGRAPRWLCAQGVTPAKFHQRSRWEREAMGSPTKAHLLQADIKGMPYAIGKMYSEY